MSDNQISMGSAALLSVDEYLQGSFQPAREYIGGALGEKPMPAKLPARIQFLLVTFLRKLAGVTLRLSETRFLVPDVITDVRMEDRYPIKVALCVEILSPEERPSAAIGKCQECHAWGVPHCWLIDPINQTAWAYHDHCEPRFRTKQDCEPSKIGRDGVLGAGKLETSLAARFAEQPQ